jgi:hypothetical protein
MRTTAILLAMLMPAAMATAEEIASAYTDLDPGKDCILVAAAAEGEGDWADLICTGYRGFPVILRSADARDSAFYGFPPAPDDLAWESFSAFNAVGPKVEWRIAREGNLEVPFAVIHRSRVSDPEDAERQVEVLVVEKVGQLDERQGCAVGLVMATGNPQANETARRIADEQARTFACGADERVLVGDAIPEFGSAN